MPRIFHKLLLSGATSCIIFYLASNSYADHSIELGDEAASIIEQQRDDFMAAEEALNRGSVKKFKQLTSQLEHYPLYPYLRYQYLRTRLHKRPSEEIATFIEQYEGSPLSPRLHFRWMRKLAQKGRWNTIEQHYRPGNNTTLQCYYRRALLNNGKQEAAFENLQTLWLVGRSQPRACDPLFNAWNKAGFIDDELAWQRIRLAMGKRKLTLTRYLTRFLSESERRWANRWIEVHRNPSRILSKKRFNEEHPMRNTILAHGVKRMARLDPLKAAKAWQETISQRYSFSADEITSVERAIAMAMALRNKPEALSWLAALEEKPSDQTLREWRVRTALREQNWDVALAWFYQLNDDEQQEPRWQYWHARTLEALGQQQQADEIYTALAMKRGYYSFLAADKLEHPYRFQHVTLKTDNLMSANIEQHPSILRARELFLLDRVVEARREWLNATRHMVDEQLYQAGQLAHSWGWHDRAILTIARTEHRDDLDLRFPLAYKEKITVKAGENNVETALAFALIRQESAFTSDARSSAGAMGLMQLMPRTAKRLTSGTGIRINNRMQLIDIDTNLKLGMKHLGKVLKRFDNNPVLALAAYNAGQARAKRWIPREHQIDADIWAETIPFSETRHYIQNIMAFTPIYERHLGEQLTPLKQRMAPIGTAPPVIAQHPTSAAAPVTEAVATPQEPIMNTAPTIAPLDPLSDNSLPPDNEAPTTPLQKKDSSSIKTMQFSATIEPIEDQLGHQPREGI